MKVEIIGAGALGLLFGSQLAMLGVEVVYWTRTREQASLLMKEGITCIDEVTAGEERRQQVSCVSARSIDTCNNEALHSLQSPDWIFLNVKQRDITDSVIKLMAMRQGMNTGIVCFQNGMGHLERIAEIIRNNKVYAAVTTEGAKRLDERTVKRANPGDTRIGEWGKARENSSDHLTESLVITMNRAGFLTSLSKDIERDIYRKLLINAVINPLTALWRVPNGELLVSRNRIELMHKLIEEALLIYNAYEISYAPDIEEQIYQVCRTTSGNISSMLTDVLQGNMTEIDYINGRLVEMARKANLPAPCHELVWKLVQGLSPQMA